jgi:hypothetical protein
MPIERLIAILVSCGLAATATALPLTLLVDVSQSAPHQAPPAQTCLIGTNNCTTLWKAPARLCSIATKACGLKGDWVAVSQAPTRK